jgi:hypothetical protein
MLVEVRGFPPIPQKRRMDGARRWLFNTAVIQTSLNSTRRAGLLLKIIVRQSREIICKQQRLLRNGFAGLWTIGDNRGGSFISKHLRPFTASS